VLLLLHRLAPHDTRGIVGTRQAVLVVLRKIGDALLVTLTVGPEAFRVLIGVVVHGNDGDDGVLLVVIVW